MPVVFQILEHIDKNVTDTFYTQSLNFKLGTKDLNISEVAVEAAKRNMSIEDVMAMAEQDGWKYKGQWHDGESYVCSSWVASVWKAAGLFGDLELNAAEWGPKDIYQVDFFNKTYGETKPQQCKDADPNVPWCQILGKFTLTFPGFSSIQPYAHMNDHCPSIAPEFIRPDGC